MIYDPSSVPAGVLLKKGNFIPGNVTGPQFTLNEQKQLPKEHEKRFNQQYHMVTQNS